MYQLINQAMFYNKYFIIKHYIFEITTTSNEVVSVKRVYKKEKENPNEICNKVYNYLNDYFNNKIPIITFNIKLEGTEFQKKVWKELLNIPYGKLVTYKDIATSIDNPKSSRGVGGAVGKNNFLIIIPCHRVIGSNNKLTGFSAGLDLKKYLLEIEGSINETIKIHI